jgi:hypothetical protein
METPGAPPPGPDEEPTHRTEPVGGPTVMVSLPTGARLPLPGNAEWALWFCVEIVFAIIWAASDAVDAGSFVQVSAIITFAYLVSRGIAKASRVLEQ